MKSFFAENSIFHGDGDRFIPPQNRILICFPHANLSKFKSITRDFSIFSNYTCREREG